MDQHLVSQFVIKNWAGDDGQVEVFDLRRWNTRRELPGSIMFVASDDAGKGIVPVEFAQTLESDWSLIESYAADALEGDCSTLGADSERRQAVLDLMALHLLRSSEMLAVQTGLIAQEAAKVLRGVQTDKEWGRTIEEEPSRKRGTLLARRSCTRWHLNPHCAQRSRLNVDSTDTTSAPGVSSTTSNTRICAKCSRTAITSQAIGALLDR